MRDRLSLVCPTFMESSRDASDIVEEFGPAMDRYLARYPANWVERWDAYLKEKRPMERKASMRFRDDIQRALVKVSKSADYDFDSTWSENAVQIIEGQSFEHVVGDFADPTPFNNWPRSLQAIRDSKPKAKPVGKSLEDYFDLARPLIRVAPEVYFVDPFFDPLSELGTAFAAGMIDLARESRCFRLHFMFAKRRNSRPLPEQVELGQLLSKRFEGRSSADRQVNFFVIDDVRGRDHLDFHMRGILTRFGARKIEKGFVLTRTQGEFVENKAAVIPRHDIEGFIQKYIAVAEGTWSQYVTRYSF